jgi:hypothetical protein
MSITGRESGGRWQKGEEKEIQGYGNNQRGNPICSASIFDNKGGK